MKSKIHLLLTFISRSNHSSFTKIILTYLLVYNICSCVSFFLISSNSFKLDTLFCSFPVFTYNILRSSTSTCIGLFQLHNCKVYHMKIQTYLTNFIFMLFIVLVSILFCYCKQYFNEYPCIYIYFEKHVQVICSISG